MNDFSALNAWILDPNEFSGLITSQMMRNLGFVHVKYTADVSDTVAAEAMRTADLIVIDLKTAQLDEFHFVRQLRSVQQKPKRTSLLVTATEGHRPLIQKAARAGADAIVFHPFSQSTFRERVLKALSNSQ